MKRAVIARIHIGDDLLVVTLERDLVDVRVHTPTGGLHFPSNNGVTIKREHLAELIDALERATRTEPGMSTSRNPLPPAQAKLHKRAVDELAHWQKTLPKRVRRTLKPSTRTDWGHRGGNIILVKAPPTRRQARQRKEREQLKLKREARLRAERAAYEERLNAKPHGDECGKQRRK